MLYLRSDDFSRRITTTPVLRRLPSRVGQRGTVDLKTRLVPVTNVLQMLFYFCLFPIACLLQAMFVNS